MDYLKIGFIKKPHGLKGELKVLPLTDNPERYNLIKKVFLYNNNQYDEYIIDKITISKKDEIILKLKDCNSKEEAENLRNLYIFIDKNEGLKLNEWEYYSADLVDCEIIFNNCSYGKIIDIVNFGAQDNFLVLYNKKEIYYPFLKSLIEAIDIKKKKIIINQIEGFFD